MVKYSICMVNYDMADTIRQSVTSILEQVTDEFEVIVVDGGSSDGSLDILSSLSSSYQNFRYKALGRDPERRLGKDRQISIEEATGEYVIFQVDCDDIYKPAIVDFTQVYHQIESGVNFEFLMKGCAISMAPKELIMDIGGFRNVGRREDRDLWRRAFSKCSVIWLDHKPFWESVGYDDDKTTIRISKVFDEIATDIQVGLSPIKTTRWLLRKGKVNRWSYLQILMLPAAYLASHFRDRYTTPAGYRDPAKLFELIQEERASLEQLSDRYEFELNKSQFSNLGEDIFFPEGQGYNYRGNEIELVGPATE